MLRKTQNTKTRKRLLTFVTLVGLGSTSCLYSVTYTNGGYHREGVFLPKTPPGPPPPRIKDPPIAGLELEWRPELGVYEVKGSAGVYYRLVQFFRCSESGRWQVADRIEGPWHLVGDSPSSVSTKLPEGLLDRPCRPSAGRQLRDDAAPLEPPSRL